MPNLDPIIPTLKSGSEPFCTRDREINLTLHDFWRWSVSDLISNATRGRLAEFIVASAIGIDLNMVRDEWAPYDLISPEGVKIEVKSSAYLQSWAQREYSKIIYSIAPARFWDSATNAITGPPRRPADLYVFTLLKHKEAETLNPLQLEQWEFYVVSTAVLDHHFPKSKTISLKSIQKHASAIGYENLRREVLAQHR